MIGSGAVSFPEKYFQSVPHTPASSMRSSPSSGPMRGISNSWTAIVPGASRTAARTDAIGRTSAFGENRHQATIAEDLLAGDEARFIRSQKEHRGRLILWPTPPAQRNRFGRTLSRWRISDAEWAAGLRR